MKYTLLVAGLLAPLSAAAAQSVSAGPEVVTAGTGTVLLPPDRAMVRITVATRAASASAASTSNGPVVTRVQDTLRVLGFAGAAVRAVSFGVTPNYDYQNARRIVDYEARTTLEVRLRDLGTLSSLLDGALAAGATDVSSITFESDSLPAARNRALAAALAAARADAETLARAAGGRLGKLRQVTTTPASTPMELRAAAPPTSLAGGVPAVLRDVVVSVWVQARWALVVP